MVLLDLIIRLDHQLNPKQKTKSPIINPTKNKKTY